MNKILVTPKINPDLDGTSCALAYAYFLREHGIDAEGIIFGSPQSEVNYFVDHHGIQIPTHAEDQQGEWENFILVDASSMKGMPKPVIPDKVIEIIDHRAGSEAEKEFRNAKIQNELIGAAATLVTERFMHENLAMPVECAKLLYGAIHHNSLNFLSTNTSKRDRIAAAFLEREYNFDKKIIEDMFLYATRGIMKDVEKALGDDGKELGKGYAIGVYQLIVWGDDIMQRKNELEEAVRHISTENEELWAVLNIIDVSNAKGFLSITDKKNSGLIEAALDTNLTDGWAVFEPPLLRKQIMPLINDRISMLE